MAADQVDGFLAIDAKGNVTVYSGKVDLGTGIRTAMTQIAAEELSVPLDRVTVIQGDTLLTPDQGITFGSLSIQNGGMQIRQAAATARQALLIEGATKLGLDKDAVVVKDGVVGPKAGGKGVAYAALVGGKDFRIAVDAKAPTKDPKDYTIVGKPVARLDIPDKVTGRFTYMQDFRRKGMLHARVIRPAGMKATLLSWNDFDCRKTPGYVGVVKKGNFLAVLARSEWGAIEASRSGRDQVVGLGGAPRPGEVVGGGARRQGRQGRGPAEDRRRRRGAQDAGRENRVGDLRFRDPHAWLDRTVVRGRGVRRWQAHRLERVAADAPVAQADRADAGTEAR